MNSACMVLFANTVAELLPLTKEQLKEAPVSYLLLHTETSKGPICNTSAKYIPCKNVTKSFVKKKRGGEEDDNSKRTTYTRVKTIWVTGSVLDKMKILKLTFFLDEAWFTSSRNIISQNN